ncbi:MAG: CRISPR-associated endonuclease Cas1 [Deltaproteobacteria bacterium]|nr:CRISPR-associated endonuclease Cas1 [Deltaproteobacteria bacterium]
MTETIINASAHEHADLIPVRMCNELVYCPRLFHLEHVQGVFRHSADTIEGKGQHERAKRRGSRLRVIDDEPAAASTIDDLFALLPRRLALVSERLGIRGEIDLVEVHDGSVVVVEAKRGRAPRTDAHRWGPYELPVRAWPADLAQVVLYMALLRDHGLPCDQARLVYRGSHESVVVAWSDHLERFVHAVIAQARAVALCEHAPAPLVDSPKCPGCSLHDVCLPDEHNALLAEQAARAAPPQPDASRDPALPPAATGDADATNTAPQTLEDHEALAVAIGVPANAPVRRIVTGLEPRSVVHVLTPGSTVRKDGDALVVEDRRGGIERFVLPEVAHLALFGPVHVTQPCVQHLLRQGVAISHHTGAGRLLGTTAPLLTRNVGLRRAQFRVVDDPQACLEIARALVVAKIRNQRTVLRRHRRGLAVISDAVLGGDLPHWAGGPDPQVADARRDAQGAVAEALGRMQHALAAATRAVEVDRLRGHEGDAAACYFGALPAILPAAWRGELRGRSRRPPQDRINAMLSFGYALLVRDAVAACGRVGLDPMLGVFHTMIPGRPALALDLMEPLRAAWVDTAVLRLIATAGIVRDDFHCSLAGVELSDAGRRAMIRAYERRGDEQTTHPRFGYRMSYRRLLELEVRILAKVFAGELRHYTPMWTR